MCYSRSFIQSRILLQNSRRISSWNWMGKSTTENVRIFWIFHLVGIENHFFSSLIYSNIQHTNWTKTNINSMEIFESFQSILSYNLVWGFLINVEKASFYLQIFCLFYLVISNCKDVDDFVKWKIVFWYFFF
jgi:hypothetical protein